MNRLNILFISLVLSVLLTACDSNDDKGNLRIKNSTDQSISNIKIDYTNNEDFLIKSIESEKEYVYKILDTTDDSIKLVFKDAEGNKYEQIIVGYVTRGIENVNVNITKGDDGKFLIYVDE